MPEQPLYDFTAPKVRRGRLTNARTGSALLFSLNPTKFSVKGGVNSAEDPIVGGSDPLIRFMSGKGKTISFSLIIDGDMNLRVFGAQMPNAANTVEVAPRTWGTGPADQRLAQDGSNGDISSYLEFLDSFTHPVDPTLPGVEGGNDRIVLSFGNYFRAAPSQGAAGLVCTMESLEHDVNGWDPNLNPIRSTTNITLKRYVTETAWAHQIWRGVAQRY